MGAGTMISEDIIRLAREAGGYVSEMPMGDAWLFDDAALERFAALVAAAEREACAKLCDSEVEKLTQWHPREARAVGVCADTIRARGESK
jgi:predicted metal-dependent hydrolase